MGGKSTPPAFIPFTASPANSSVDYCFCIVWFVCAPKGNNYMIIKNKDLLPGRLFLDPYDNHIVHSFKQLK